MRENESFTQMPVTDQDCATVLTTLQYHVKFCIHSGPQQGQASTDSP